jgi:hypothetical protein
VTVVRFALFDDALEAFFQAAPIGFEPTVIRAGRSELEQFRQWADFSQHTGRGPVGDPPVEYHNCTVEPVSEVEHLSVQGAAPDGALFEWPSTDDTPGETMLGDYFANFSTDGLKKMHLAVLHAFQKDEETPKGQPKPYGVREYADWKKWSDALEGELRRRKAQFTNVPW